MKSRDPQPSIDFDNSTRVQKPLLGTTIVHLSMMEIALLLEKLSIENISKLAISNKIFCLKNMITKLTQGDTASIIINTKDREKKIPIEILADHCPVIVENQECNEFKQCIKWVIDCANMCDTHSPQSKNALAAIVSKLEGKYPKAILSASSKYIFWNWRDEDEKKLEQSLSDLKKYVSKLK